MQMVIAIPCREELEALGGAEEALLRKLCGVPLLVRVIATGMRAGADRLLVIHSRATVAARFNPGCGLEY
jgi:CMP-2-keto-3-deoxyoctulosonic acid synthetase